MRKAEIKRKTAETDIALALQLDGNGASVNGGIGPDTVLEKLVSSLEEKGKAILPQVSGLVGTILLISLLTSLGRSISEGCERLLSSAHPSAAR